MSLENQIPIAEDRERNPIFPGDTVVDQFDNEVKIEYGKYKEQFGFGSVYGYFIPDYCLKKLINEKYE